MKEFSQLGINKPSKKFEGDKIRVARLLDRKIVVYDYKIEPSKKIQGDTCLHMQISLNDEKHVVFTSSKGLMEMIQQVPREEFPIGATIIEVNKQYQFET